MSQFSVSESQSKCHTEGALGHCTATSIQAQNLPWQAHVHNTDAVQVTGVQIATDLHGFLCPDLTIHLNNAMDFVELTGEKDGAEESTTVDAVEIDGTVTATPIGTVELTGTISATAGQQDRYGWT